MIDEKDVHVHNELVPRMLHELAHATVLAGHHPAVLMAMVNSLTLGAIELCSRVHTDANSMRRELLEAFVMHLTDRVAEMSQKS